MAAMTLTQALTQAVGLEPDPGYRPAPGSGAPPPGGRAGPSPPSLRASHRPPQVRRPREGWIDPRDEFIAHVNARRKRLGLTWAALAEQLGVSPQTMSRFKCKTARGPSKDLVERLLGRWDDLAKAYARAYGKKAPAVAAPPGPEGR